MAIESPVTDSDNYFVGEDKVWQYTIYAADDVTIVNPASWSLVWKLAQRPADPVALVIHRSVALDSHITVVSSIVHVQVDDVDTVNLSPGNYWHELWRVDENMESMLSFGAVVFKQSLRET